MSRFTVIYDANVLYPATVRDLLLQLATTGLFKARWTEKIHEEWVESLLRKQPEVEREKISRTRELMDKAVDDPLVYGYESLLGTFGLPDCGDEHVMASAVRANADAIVTFNLDDFPCRILDDYDLQAIHPDEFIILQFDLKPSIVCECVKKIRARLKDPRYDVDGYLTHLAAVGLPRTAERLNSWASVL